MTIEAALAEIDALGPGEGYSYQDPAKKYGVWRSTLSRRHQAVHASHDDEAPKRRVIHPQNEELVQYIERLTERLCPPTRRMIKNFAHPIAKKEVSESWITRFINRHKTQLISMWLTTILVLLLDSYSFLKPFYLLVE
jgi:hypothetical protein